MSFVAVVVVVATLCKNVYVYLLVDRNTPGSELECIYQLISFGITKDLLPISTSGKVKLDNHKRFMQQRQARDASSTSLATTTTPTTTMTTTTVFPFHAQQHQQKQKQKQKQSHLLPPVLLPKQEERVMVPRPLDVLQGRGRHFVSHPGNVRLQTIIQDFAERYERAETCEKTKMAERIVALIQTPELQPFDGNSTTDSATSSSSSSLPLSLPFSLNNNNASSSSCGGRFLIQDDSGWKVMADETARGRVSHKFRNLRLRPNSKNPSSASHNHNNNDKNKNNTTKQLLRSTSSTTSTISTTNNRKTPTTMLWRDEEATMLMDNGLFGCFSDCKRQRLQ
jgi:hypothetical protein